MRVIALLALPLASLLMAAACNMDAHPQPAAPTATTTYANGYPPPPGYGYPPPGYSYPPPGYATAAPTPYPQPAPAPAPTPYPQPAPAPAPTPYPQPAPAPSPTPTSSLSVPGPLAIPCSSDAVCGLHHCNAQYGKCAFPCQTGADCTTGNCVVGVCMPGAPH